MSDDEKQSRVESLISRCVIDGAEAIRSMLGLNDKPVAFPDPKPFQVRPRHVRTTSKRLNFV
jgi:hypothetical protein